MLALRSKMHPETHVARSLLAGLFGTGAVHHEGTFYEKLEARGLVNGAPVRVLFEMANTRRSGIQPYTTIDLEDDFDVDVYQGSSHVVHSNVPLVRFEHPELVDCALYGAPKRLLGNLVRGPIGGRLAAIVRAGSHFSRIAIGVTAKKDDARTRGVRLCVGGWPEDAASLRFLVDTAVAMGLETRRELASVGLGRGMAHGARHPEMVAYDASRAAAREAAGRVIVAAAFALTVLFVVFVAATVFGSYLLRT